MDGRPDRHGEVDARVHPADAEDGMEAHPEARREAAVPDGQDGRVLAQGRVSVAGELAELLVGAALVRQLTAEALHRAVSLAQQVAGRSRVAVEPRVLGPADAHLEGLGRDRLRMQNGPVELAVRRGEVGEFLCDTAELRVGLRELRTERPNLVALRDLGGRGDDLREHAHADSGQHDGERNDDQALDPPIAPARGHLDEGARLVVVGVKTVRHRAESRATGGGCNVCARRRGDLNLPGDTPGGNHRTKSGLS